MAKQSTTETITIKAPRIETLSVRIRGTAPYVQLRFGTKAKNSMLAKMMAGGTGRGKKVREAKDPAADMREAMYQGPSGEFGIPASAFRNAMIDVCRMVGFKMTMAKMSVFVLHDSCDTKEGTPIVHLDAGPPERLDMAVRNATGGPDIRIRPMWREWGANVRIQFDADQFTASDVVNLLSRAGLQVGVGEGRPFSKNSGGLGFGRFTVESVAGGAS
jgi:hypothetical protein